MGPNETEHLEGTEIGTQEPYKHKIKISFFLFYIGYNSNMVPTGPKIKISPQVTNFLCEDVVSQMFPGASAVVVKS